MSQLQPFRADIQGLRALAIVPVVIYHAAGDWLPGGFVGVDVFFVISGFLITRILAREIEAGTFSIAGFYARRVRRLFPALFVMLAATLAAGLLLLPPEPLAELGESAAWTAFFAANIHQYFTLNYFTAAVDLAPLAHTWTLGVEEQFYIAFPVFLAVMSRFAPRLLLPAIWAGALVSLAWSWHLTQVLPHGAFYLPHSRAYQLAIGALLALGAVPRIHSARALGLLSTAGLAMILAAYGLIDARTPYPGLAGLLPCLGAGLIIYAGDRAPAGRLLALAPMQAVGAISYSLYLWHWPVLVFARFVVLGDLGAGAIAACLVVSVALAVASYRLLETPVKRSGLSTRSLLIGGALLAVVTAAAGLALHSGLPQRFDSRALAMFAAKDGYSPRRAECHYEDGPTDYARSCVLGNAPASVAVWGDSFGVELSAALGEQLAREGRAVRQLTASACPPSLGYSRWDRPQCAGHNAAVLAGLLGDDAAETVVVVAHYSGYGADQARVLGGMREAVHRLHTAGKRIVLVYPIPSPGFDVPMALGLTIARGSDPASFGPSLAQVAADNRLAVAALDALARETGAQVVRPVAGLCDRSHCRAIGTGGEVLYFDDRHLSVAGARLVAGRY